jgi:hypothetical protein
MGRALAKPIASIAARVMGFAALYPSYIADVAQGDVMTLDEYEARTTARLAAIKT